MKNTLLIYCIIIVIAHQVYSQETNKKPWNNKQCAVVLTYDDGLDCHLDKVIPLLDSMGFNGTFYIPGYSHTLLNRYKDWKIAAQNGHELGNHTLFHPCAGKSKNREWVNPENDLDNYSIKHIVDEIKIANTLLHIIDDKRVRTFAYPCGDFMVGDSSYIELIEPEFIAARLAEDQKNYFDKIDMFRIGSEVVRTQTSKELIEIAESAKNEQRLVVFLFHGVGGEHPISIALEEHNAFVKYLKENEQYFWVTSLVNVSLYIKNQNN